MKHSYFLPSFTGHVTLPVGQLGPSFFVQCTDSNFPLSWIHYKLYHVHRFKNARTLESCRTLPKWTYAVQGLLLYIHVLRLVAYLFVWLWGESFSVNLQTIDVLIFINFRPSYCTNEQMSTKWLAAKDLIRLMLRFTRHAALLHAFREIIRMQKPALG